MKEELHKSAATPTLLDEQNAVQIYADLLTSLTAGNSLEDACKALSLDVNTVRRDFLPSEGFRRQLREFMAEQVTHAATALASLREPALHALKIGLLNFEAPGGPRLAHRILRDLAGPARDLRKRPRKKTPKRRTRSKRK